MKSIRKQLSILYRQGTSRFRSLPHFIIIGAQKSGTSSLFRYVAEHPQIRRGSEKEVHFFSGGFNPDIDNYRKGPHWYRAHFPLKLELDDNQITGEATPLYLANPLAPSRIHNLIPDVKLIAVLRNPTERAISHYYHEVRMNMEPLSIMDALKEEDSRMEAVLRNGDFKSNTFLHHSYKLRGLYKQQLESYLQFFSREQLLIINSEALFSRPVDILKDVFDFLGINRDYIATDIKPRNIGRNKSDVAPEVFEYLDKYFLPHNEMLYQLVGESYDW